MSEGESRKESRNELRTLPMETRRAIGSAIIEGLITPAAIGFERLATEGGDYDQGSGGYNQGGGGNHAQGNGDYNQHAVTVREFVDVSIVNDLIRTQLP